MKQNQKNALEQNQMTQNESQTGVCLCQQKILRNFNGISGKNQIKGDKKPDQNQSKNYSAKLFRILFRNSSNFISKF